MLQLVVSFFQLTMNGNFLRIHFGLSFRLRSSNPITQSFVVLYRFLTSSLYVTQYGTGKPSLVAGSYRRCAAASSAVSSTTLFPDDVATTALITSPEISTNTLTRTLTGNFNDPRESGAGAGGLNIRAGGCPRQHIHQLMGSAGSLCFRLGIVLAR